MAWTFRERFKPDDDMNGTFVRIKKIPFFGNSDKSIREQYLNGVELINICSVRTWS